MLQKINLFTIKVAILGRIFVKSDLLFLKFIYHFNAFSRAGFSKDIFIY